MRNDNCLHLWLFYNTLQYMRNANCLENKKKRFEMKMPVYFCKQHAALAVVIHYQTAVALIYRYACLKHLQWWICVHHKSFISLLSCCTSVRPCGLYGRYDGWHNFYIGFFFHGALSFNSLGSASLFLFKELKQQCDNKNIYNCGKIAVFLRIFRGVNLQVHWSHCSDRLWLSCHQV